MIYKTPVRINHEISLYINKYAYKLAHALNNPEYLNICKLFRLSAAIRHLGLGSTITTSQYIIQEKMYYWCKVALLEATIFKKKKKKIKKLNDSQVSMLNIEKIFFPAKLHCFVLCTGDKSCFINISLQHRKMNPSLSR